MKQNLDAEIDRLASMAGPRVVVSPYRICPIGAHSDHQGGPVLGMAVSLYSLLAFSASSSSEVTLTSENYSGETRFDIRGLRARSPTDVPPWGRYAIGAALALGNRLSARPRGITGIVSGGLPDAGLSSSASVILAYLSALAEANDLTLEKRELAQLALEAERDYVGVKVGILDPAAIVAARKGHLVAIDTRRVQWRAIPLGADAPEVRILVAFSGITRNLSGTDYNRRVEECFASATKLARLSGRGSVDGLDELESDLLEVYGDLLTPAEALRARHFFGERRRVRRGAQLWQEGDLAGFGELMRESCESSIHYWESGSPELITIQRILEKGNGVFGSRFSGAGWGGCCLALVDRVRAESLRQSVEQEIRKALPDLGAHVTLVESEDGLSIVGGSR